MKRAALLLSCGLLFALTLPPALLRAQPAAAAAQTPAPQSAPACSAANGTTLALAKVTAGDHEITVQGAIPGQDYEAWERAPATTKGSTPPVWLASTKAEPDCTLSFKDLTQAPIAGDTVRILSAEEGAKFSNSKNFANFDLIEPSTVVAGTAFVQLPRVIAGYEQSGANSANSVGRLYIDVYYAHELRRASSPDNKPAAWQLFGNVDIGSSAQNLTSTVGDYVAGISGTASSIKINQVASAAEFLTGLEYNALRTRTRRLAIFGEYGALGALQTGELNNTYAFPAQDTQAYNLLVDAEQMAPGYNPAQSIATTCSFSSSSLITGVANNCMFVEFSQPQPYFDQEAYVGIRAVSFLPGSVFAGAAPAILSAGAGANHAVNLNMDFNSLRFDGLVPFAVPSTGGAQSKTPVLYLFGYASLAIDHSHFPNSSNFINLNPVSSVIANNKLQTPSSGNTYVIYSQRTPQEFYSIGVGLDLVEIWSALSTSKKNGQ